MKNIIIPIVFVAIIIGGIVVLSGTQRSKNKDTSTSGSSSTTAQTDKPAYFDDNAKVMFFYSDLCSWCNKEKTEVLAEIVKEGYKVKPMDVKAHPDYWETYKIEGTPAFIAPDGERLTGFQDKDKLKAFLDKYK